MSQALRNIRYATLLNYCEVKSTTLPALCSIWTFGLRLFLLAVKAPSPASLQWLGVAICPDEAEDQRDAANPRQLIALRKIQVKAARQFIVAGSQSMNQPRLGLADHRIIEFIPGTKIATFNR